VAQSSEYSDLRWIPPASYSPGRPGGKPRFIVVHTTEGSSHSQSAEDGAVYDGRRTDGTSTHYFVDDSSVVQCVRTTDRAHTAGPSGNLHGIQYELCAKAGYGTAWWTGGSYAKAMLRRAARQAARDAKRYDIPVKRITPRDLLAGGRGFCGHVDVTNAWREVDHTDPGPSFPWSMFLDMVNEEMGSGAKADEPEGEDDMPIFESKSHVIPVGYAYDSAGVEKDRTKMLSVGVEPAGFAANPIIGKNRLYLSVGGDHIPADGVKVRVAVHDGEGWSEEFLTLTSKEGRKSARVPAPKNGSAFKITVGRCEPAGETIPAAAEDAPLFLVVTVG
jgi:N-acetyl-anhydromuramyl-L-alanine amidase AmpD